MLKKPILVLVSLLSILNGKSFAAGENKIKVRADLWCPYNCEPKDKEPGYMIEVLQKAFGKENVDYELMNWARAILDTRDKKYDAIVGAAKEDAPDFIFSSPLGISKTCFYMKDTNKFEYNEVDSLSSIKLGIIKDYAYFDDLNAYIKKYYADRNKIDEHFGDDAQDKMLQKLRLGRLDGVVEDQNVMNYKLKQKDIKDIIEFKPGKNKKDGCSTQLNELYIAFPPGNPKSEERKEILSKTIDAMIKNGEMTKLLEKYSLKPWY